MNVQTGASDNVRPVNRVKHGALLALAAATVASGCTTFSDNDAIARVDDAELSPDQLIELIGAVDPETATDANVAREAIGIWIGERLPTERDAGDAPKLYNQGILASGSLCSRAMVTEVAADRDAAMQALDDGGAWPDVLAEYNVNPQLGQTNGELGCGGVQDYAGTGVFTLFSALSETTPYASETIDDDPTLPVFVIGQFIPYEELGPEQTASVIAGLPPDISGLDIYVDPHSHEGCNP